MYDVRKAIEKNDGYLEIRSGKSRYVIMPERFMPERNRNQNNKSKDENCYIDKISIEGKLDFFPGVHYRIYLPIKGEIKKDKQLSLFD